MTKTKIKDLLNKGYKIKVALTPDKKHEKATLKTIIYTDDSLYEIYYNHCKDFLTSEQLRLIETFSTVSRWQLRDKVDFQTAYHTKRTEELEYIKRVFGAIHTLEKIVI